jgi:molecular chaperone IbpA
MDAPDSTNARPDSPPYDIERGGEHQYRISMAIVGFGPNEIVLTQQGNTLFVAGQKERDRLRSTTRRIG